MLRLSRLAPVRLLSSHTPKSEPKLFKQEYLDLAENWPKEKYNPEENYKYFSTKEDGPYPHTSPHPDGSDSFETVPYSSAFITKCGVAVIALFLVVRTNSYLFPSDQPHPLTALVGDYVMTPERLMADMTVRWELAKQEMADTQIIR
jgi:hypothetical protein